jgi:hypothetical protein
LGEQDGWIALADLETMGKAVRDRRLAIVPGTGMDLELTTLYDGWLGGLAK